MVQTPSKVLNSTKKNQNIQKSSEYSEHYKSD